MTTYFLIRWPWETEPKTIIPLAKEVLLVPDPEPKRNEFDEIRKSITDLTIVTAAQNEKLSTQSKELERAHQLIKALQTVESQLRGDLREAYTRITALEQQLNDARVAGMHQAEELGVMKSQLDMADSRLQKQRTDISTMGNQIAILESDKAAAINVSQVWELRAQAYKKQLRQAGIVPIDEEA